MEHAQVQQVVAQSAKIEVYGADPSPAEDEVLQLGVAVHQAEGFGAVAEALQVLARVPRHPPEHLHLLSE